jgi:hypothetical protein
MFGVLGFEPSGYSGVSGGRSVKVAAFGRGAGGPGAKSATNTLSVGNLTEPAVVRDQTMDLGLGTDSVALILRRAGRRGSGFNIDVRHPVRFAD